MKFYIIFSIILFQGVNLVGQNQGIKWGKEYKDEGFYSILGAADEAVFVERKFNTNYDDRQARMELMRFDADLQLTHTVDLRDIEKTSYESIATIDSPEGLAHIYYQTTKDGDHYVSAQLFRHSDLRKTEIVDLVQFKMKSNSKQILRQDADFKMEYPLDILISKDKSKMAILFTEERAGKRDNTSYQYAIIDIKNKFNLLFKDGFYSDDRSDKYLISDKFLSNSGKLTYILKHYQKDRDREHENKKPDYDYEIHHMSGDTSDYIFDIKVNREYLDELTVRGDNNDNIYVAGFYRSQPFGEISKSFLLSLNPRGYERYQVLDKYSRRDIEEMQGKEDDHLDENFEIVDILPGNDIVYLIHQYRRRNTRSNNNNNFNGGAFGGGFGGMNNRYYYWQYDEVVIEGIGVQTGERQWITSNPRAQEDDNYFDRYFITGRYELMGNDLYLFYNEREENIARIRKRDNVKRSDIPGDRTSFTLAKVTSDGTIKYDVFSEEDYYHVPTNGLFITNDKVFIFNQHKHYKKFVLGYMDKASITE